MDYTINNRLQTTLGNRHPYGIQGCYPCRGEDRWVCITILNEDDWAAFCGALGDPEWSRDPRFADPLHRWEHHDEIDRHIGEWTSQQDHYEVMRLLQSVGVAAGPVMDQRDAYNDPHLNERGVFQEVFQEDTGTHRYPAAPFTMSETPLQIRRGPVRLGEDNEYVYKTLLKFTDEEYAELQAAGHIGTEYSQDLP
jgi:crotonobetainyl-CoA:carnitine CoA-transferase CaiB-like acyl-CoA transferase